LTAKFQPTPTAPIHIGRRLLVVPLDFPGEVPAALIAVRLAPSTIFGSGTHPTTQLCLLALERHLPVQVTVVDLGTGNGILAIAAAKLGASKVFACDIDPVAVEVARQNVTANGVDRQVCLQTGSLAEVLADQAERGPADVVLVNILAGVVESLFKAGLVTAVKPGGLLVLSGLLPAQTAIIRARLQMAGCQLLAQEQRGEWVCLLAKRLPTKDN
jgi:ribosomal protein L11 methyltransferase